MALYNKTPVVLQTKNCYKNLYYYENSKTCSPRGDRDLLRARDSRGVPALAVQLEVALFDASGAFPLTTEWVASYRFEIFTCLFRFLFGSNLDMF